MSDQLKSCPFCGGGETHVRESTFWTGMRNEVVSANVMHWCERQEGQPQSVLQLVGRDRESAIAIWNGRKENK